MKKLTTTTETPSTAWAARITTAWRASVDAIIAVGQLLIDAKKALPHGAFMRMVQNELPFGARTAQRLMKIADDERLRDAAHASLLPPSWMTLYQLTRLSPAAFKRGVADKIIRADMERVDLDPLLPMPRPPKVPEMPLYRTVEHVEHADHYTVPATVTHHTRQHAVPMRISKGPSHRLYPPHVGGTPSPGRDPEREDHAIAVQLIEQYGDARARAIADHIMKLTRPVEGHA